MSNIKFIKNTEIDNIASATGKALKSQKKVRVMIPSAKDNEVWEGGINGHFFRFPCNEAIEVPEDLALVIESSRKIIREKNALEAKYAEGKKMGGTTPEQEGKNMGGATPEQQE